MGRRCPVAVDAVLRTSAADSSRSSSSAESSFRELDDVFLQKQTRIWLGEVLKTRLNEDIHISDLLADGEFLFEVSKLVWNMLLEKCFELRHLKAYQRPFRSRKSSGRYMPYSNVDSFLKICKVLGLNGIDLFSPSDVVEKRDTRKVCICIRALSKKARSKQLNVRDSVPDFDVVSHTIAMPTDMVGCIRRSLESSQCSFSSSSSYNSFKDSRYKIQQKSTSSECGGNYDSASDVSDEAESKYYGLETYCCSENNFSDPATLNLDTEFSSDAFSAVKQQSEKKGVSPPELGEPYVSELKNGDQKLAFGLESVNSLHCSRNGNDPNNLSSCRMKSQMNLHYRNSCVNTDIRLHYGDTLELNDVDLALRNDDSSVGDSLFDNLAGRNFISDYLAFSDSVVFGADGSSPFLLDGEDNMCNFFKGIDSPISSSNRENRLYQKSPDDMEDVEVSSTTSMSSILGRMLNMDFDEQFDVVDSSTMKVDLTAFPEAHSERRKLLMEDQIQEVAEFETLSHSSVTVIKESQHETRVGNTDFIGFHSTCHNQGQQCDTGSQVHEDNSISQLHPGEPKFMGEKHSGSSALSSGDISEEDQENTGYSEKIIGCSEHAIEDHREQTLDSLAENVLDERKDPSSGHQRPLLKTFVGGTALVGVLFLFLRISRRGQMRTEEPSKQLNQTQKLRVVKSSLRKEQSGKPNGTYPAEKLKFGK